MLENKKVESYVDPRKKLQRQNEEKKRLEKLAEEEKKADGKPIKHVVQGEAFLNLPTP